MADAVSRAINCKAMIPALSAAWAAGSHAPLSGLAGFANWNYLSSLLTVEGGCEHRRNAISRSD